MSLHGRPDSVHLARSEINLSAVFGRRCLCVGRRHAAARGPLAAGRNRRTRLGHSKCCRFWKSFAGQSGPVLGQQIHDGDMLDRVLTVVLGLDGERLGFCGHPNGKSGREEGPASSRRRCVQKFSQRSRSARRSSVSWQHVSMPQLRSGSRSSKILEAMAWPWKTRQTASDAARWSWPLEIWTGRKQR